MRQSPERPQRRAAHPSAVAVGALGSPPAVPSSGISSRLIVTQATSPQALAATQEGDHPQVHVGDVVLTGKAAKGYASQAIKLAERLVYGRHSPHAAYSHAALCVGHDGDAPLVAEALEEGMRIRPLWDHHWNRDVTILPTGAPMVELDRRQVVRFAHAAVDARTRYGFVTFFALAVYALTARAKRLPTINLQEEGTAICSGFVCDALARAGYIWPLSPYRMMPADISASWDKPEVRPATPG